MFRILTLSKNSVFVFMSFTLIGLIALVGSSSVGYHGRHTVLCSTHPLTGSCSPLSKFRI